MKKTMLQRFIVGATAVTAAGVTIVGCSGGGTSSGTTDSGNVTTTASSSSTNNTDTSGGEGKTLTVSIMQDTGGFDPHNYNSPMWIQSLVYEGLTRYVNDEIVPVIAKSWEVSADGKIYTFHLDPNNKFSDGTPVDAAIVKKNFDAVMKVKENHDWMMMYQVLDSVEVVDDYTVKMNLNNPYKGFLQELSLARPVRIGAEAMFPADGDTSEEIAEPIGSGPWKVVEHVVSQYTVFERNDNYHGTLPDYETLKVVVIPDINTAANSLKAGEIDMIYDVEGQMTGDTYHELEGAGFKTDLSKPITTNTVALNSASGVTQDVKVRQAMAHAIDKQSIADSIYGGMQNTADLLMSTDTPYCNFNDITKYEYSEDKANALLEEAGWKLEGDYRKKDGEELKATFLYIGDNDAIKTMGQAIQANFKKVGINLELVPQDETTFYDSQQEGLFNVIQSETWGMPFDPYSYYSSFLVPSHADYAAQKGISEKAELDQAVKDMLNTTDDAVATEKSHFILQTLADESVYVPITYTQRAIVYNSDKVSNVTFNTTLDVPYETFSVK